jgi:hypothetical protein
MKFFNQRRASLLKAVLLTSVLGVFLGCQDLKDIQNLDPLKDVVFKLNYEPAKTLMQGLVVDAATGAQLEVAISVGIFGPDANRVITYEGVKTTTFKNDKGDIFIGLQGSVPSETKPAEIRVVVDAPGYIGSSQYLTIREAKPAPFEIRLVKESAPPAGVTVKEEVVETSATGVTRTAETISTPISASNSTQVTVDIPANTQLKDDKGQPVTGNLQAQVASYSSQNETSITAFPGGFETRVSRDNAGNANAAGAFVTAGFTSIEITSSSGQKVSNFSQPVKVEMEISPALINPETDQPVKPGDKVPVFSYNENNGEWVYENEVTVKSQNGELQVELAVTHLSWYNLDWFYRSRPSCTAGAWNVTGVPTGQSFSWILYVNNAYRASGRNGANDRQVNFLYPPPGTGRLEIFAPNGARIGSSTVSNICGSRSVAVSFPATLVNATVVVRAYCENDNRIQINPSAWVYYRKAGSNGAFATAYFTAGKGTLTGLEPNTNYEAGVYYQGFQSRIVNSGNTTGTQTIDIVFTSNVSICKQ